MNSSISLILKISFIFVLAESDTKPLSLKTTRVIAESLLSSMIGLHISVVILSSKQINNAPKPIDGCL